MLFFLCFLEGYWANVVKKRAALTSFLIKRNSL